MRRHHRQTGPARRRGTLMPAIIVAIAAVCLCAALVFDRLWMDAARIELRTAAEAAALAAAGRLVSDDRLKVDSDSAALLDTARRFAVTVAAENGVAGAPVRLDPAPGGDVRFGRVTDDPYTGKGVFLETEYDPTTIVVTAQAVRSRGNGVALFFRRLTGVATGNVIARAGITIDNAVLGVRPFPGVAVPAIPLGILASDPENHRADTWNRQITGREGADQYGFDDSAQRVTDGADGIPEITLTFAPSVTATGNTESGPSQTSPNCYVIDVGNGLLEQEVRRQIVHGWSPEDFADLGGQLLTDAADVPLDASTETLADFGDAIEQIIGRPRICVLYQDVGQGGKNGIKRIRVTQLVAGRVLSIDGQSGTMQMIFQPAVITTPTVVLARSGETVAPNPYIYKLHLTH